MRLSKKLAIAAVSTVAAVSVASAAFAYWTTGGSGDGTASAGTSTPVTVSQLGIVSGLVPGGTAQAINFNINNPVSTPQYVHSVAVSFTGTAWQDGCSVADFTLVQPNAINADLSSGDHPYSPSGASIAMNDSLGNQDGCKGQPLVLHFAAS